MFVLLSVLLACGSGRIDDVMDLTGDIDAGADVYDAHCAGCHGADGTGGSAEGIAGEDESLDEIIEVVLYGEDDMPGYDGDLSDQEIADVAAYVYEVIQTGEDDDQDTD